MFENLHVPKDSYSGRNTTAIRNDEIHDALTLIARWVEKFNFFRDMEEELINVLLDTVARNDEHPMMHIALIPRLFRYTKDTFNYWYMKGNHCGARTQEILRDYYGE